MNMPIHRHKLAFKRMHHTPTHTRIALAAQQALDVHQPHPVQPVAPEPEPPNMAMAAMTKTLCTPEIEGKEEQEKSVKVEVLGTPCATDDPDGAPPEADVMSASRRHAVALGARIRAARELNGMAQLEFANAVGHKNSSQPSLWEAGRRTVPAHEIATVARALSVSTDYLLGLTDDPDADPAQSRRTALVQHLRDQLESVAGGLADAVLESGAEVEAALRTTRLMTRCETVHLALHRFKAANEAQFDELRGGAWVVRAVRELMEATATVGTELEGVAERRARAARCAKQAMQGTDF